MGFSDRETTQGCNLASLFNWRHQYLCTRPTLSLYARVHGHYKQAFVEVENTAPARSGLAGPSRATGAMRRAAELEQEFWTRMAHAIK